MLTNTDSAQVVTPARRAEKIRFLQADVARGIVDIGFELIAAKKEIGHGGWTQWLRSEFDWTDRTARYFMAIAERFGNRAMCSVLKPSTLKAMLALPVGDEDAFIAAQAKSGRPLEEQSAREVQQAVKTWNKPPIALSTGNPEWYTPATYIDAARLVLGDIDLDPASCEVANQIVKAKKFFTADQDGLKQDWHGRIWLNPPFTTGLLFRFVDKLLASNFDAAVVLTDNATDTLWFRKLAQAADALLFTSGRINFLKSDGSADSGHHIRGQAFFYFGNRADLFAAVFAQFGWLAKTFPLKEKNHADV